MGVSRRSVLGGALAAPLLAHAATESAADTSGAMGTGESGWVEVVWTPLAQAEMDRVGTTVEPIAPVESIERNGRRGLRIPLRSVQVDPSLVNPARAQGLGVADGGFVVRNASTEVRITRMEGDVRDERISGRYMINEVDAGLRSVFTWRAAEGDLSVVPGAPGEPVALKMSDLPVRMTPEMLDLMTAAGREDDLPIFSTDTVVAHVTAQSRFAPSRS